MNRRGFLINTLLGLGSSQLAAGEAAESEISENPFTLGIASGDVTASSSVLWTRLAPEPLAADGGMAPADTAVCWRVATDPRMATIIQQGEIVAPLALAHSVHVEVEGLDPDREYWYQFQAATYSSEVGRTKTLPATDSLPDSMRFITTSCQNYTHGHFVAYQHMLQDRPDFVIHLGDYIYDTSFGETFRRHDSEQPPKTLAEYRRRHALYKTDKHLQRAHAELPFFTTIDNHDAIEDANASQFAQRAAAYQAWYEHMPVRGYREIGANRFDLCRKIDIGNLAQISFLDARQFRDDRVVCDNNDYPNYGFGNYRERCSRVFEEDRSMLGEQQEQWLCDNLESNRSAWNVIASPGPFLPFSYKVDNKDLRYIGAWDVYPANRQRIAAAIDRASTGHPLILSGDVHSCWAIDGALTPETGERFPVLEFVTSSVSANWPEPLSKPVSENLVHNPQVRFYNGEKRGYLLHELSADEWKTTARAVDDVEDRNSAATTIATFVVKHGEPGFTLS